jgi:hypothetical protein
MSLHLKKLKIDKDFTFPLSFVGQNPVAHRNGVAGQPFPCARGPSLASHRPSTLPSYQPEPEPKPDPRQGQPGRVTRAEFITT